MWILIIFILLNILDIISTFLGLKQGHKEGNIIIRKLINKSPIYVVFFKFFVIFYISFIFCFFSQFIIIKISIVIFDIFYGIILFNNIFILTISQVRKKNNKL